MRKRNHWEPEQRPGECRSAAEGLVQVQVAHVRANDARRGEAKLRVHVGAIHVDLATVLVHNVASP